MGYDTHSPITSSQYAPHPFQEQNKGLLLRTHLGEVTIMEKKEGLLFNEITLIWKIYRIQERKIIGNNNNTHICLILGKEKTNQFANEVKINKEVKQ